MLGERLQIEIEEDNNHDARAGGLQFKKVALW